MLSLNSIDHIQGWFDCADLEALDYVVDRLPNNSNILEVGCFKGRSTIAWAETFKQKNKECNIHCIDLFEGHPMDKEMISLIKLNRGCDDAEAIDVLKEAVSNISTSVDFCTADEHLESFKNTIKDYNNITWEKSYVNSEYVWNGKTFDCIFIDADHKYKTTKFLIDFWKQYLNPNGLLCLHDYTPIWPGVIEAVQGSNLKQLEQFNIFLVTEVQ